MRKVKFKKGGIYHIYNRGVEKRTIFNSEADMWRFLQGMYLFNDKNISCSVLYSIEKENKGRINFNLLKEFIDKNIEERKPLVRIMADCLMPNHYHLLLEEIQDDGISNFMHRLGTGYVNYFNKKYNRVGSLFQGRFKAVAIKNDVQLTQILSYINVVNPGELVKPGLKEEGVKNMEELKEILEFSKNYSFSTNPDYLGIRESIIIDKGIYGEFFPNSDKYKEFIKNALLGRGGNMTESLLLE